MRKKKSDESFKAKLVAVRKEMAKPRIATSARGARTAEALMMHYHIRWSDKVTLDWESFDTIPDAETSAKKLMQSGETYTIEERNGDCPRCRDGVMFLKKA